MTFLLLLLLLLYENSSRICIGMVLTSFIWDYLTPYIGTRNLFIFALFADSILNVLSSAVDNYYLFLVMKFFSGVL